MTHRVTCIVRSAGRDDERKESEKHTITHLGGHSAGGEKFFLPVEQVIRDIDNALVQYYMDVDGKTVHLEVNIDNEGIRYLNTELDEPDDNTLLKLPACDT